MRFLETCGVTLNDADFPFIPMRSLNSFGIMICPWELIEAVVNGNML
jgi:hypothetical protein